MLARRFRFRPKVWQNFRKYAAVEDRIIIARPPELLDYDTGLASPLDSRILAALSKQQTPLPVLINQYLESSGHVLDTSLPYESRPRPHRRFDTDPNHADNGILMIAHCASINENEYRITISSGFALDAVAHPGDESNLVLTCAHTLDQIRHSHVLQRIKTDTPSNFVSGTFVVSGADLDSLSLHPVSAVPSAMHRSDLVLLSTATTTAERSLRTLPISPYPTPSHTAIRAHFVAHDRPDEPGWTPWIGGTWSKWIPGKVLGYRDFAGRETQPGTYDALSHMLFEPPPTAGSSGGPIVEEESGAVVGVMLGTRMDNPIEGVRGWGVPSETIFEMFTLPGLQGKK